MLSCLRRQSGNAFFLILIAVVLFAALAYAITRSSRSGTDSTTDEKNKLLLNQILAYVTDLRTAATRMQLNGIDKSTIASFFAISDIGYVDWADAISSNGGSAEQYIHHPNGGGVPMQSAPRNSVDTSNMYSYNYEVLQKSMPGIGVNTTNGDLVMNTLGTTSAICKLVNSRTPLGATIPDVDLSNLSPSVPWTMPSALYGVQEFCLRDPSDQTNRVFFVIIPDL